MSLGKLHLEIVSGRLTRSTEWMGMGKMNIFVKVSHMGVEKKSEPLDAKFDKEPKWNPPLSFSFPINEPGEVFTIEVCD